jgi:hypothetical protein
LQYLPEGFLKIHALARSSDTSVLVALSRWFEDLRSSIETGVPA